MVAEGSLIEGTLASSVAGCAIMAEQQLICQSDTAFGYGHCFFMNIFTSIFALGLGFASLRYSMLEVSLGLKRGRLLSALQCREFAEGKNLRSGWNTTPVVAP